MIFQNFQHKNKLKVSVSSNRKTRSDQKVSKLRMDFYTGDKLAWKDNDKF